VAARRFLDFPGAATLDTLIAMGEPGAVAEGRSARLLARAFGARRGDAHALRFVEAARRAEPQSIEFLEDLALIRLHMGDTAFADTTFRRILARQPANAAVLLAMGQIAAARRDAPRAEATLAKALAAGADTLQANAALALLRGNAAQWPAAAEAVRRAIAAVRMPTFRHPFPYAVLGDALGTFAANGSPALADTLISAALVRRPSWSRLHALKAAAALRGHRCEDAADAFNELLTFGIDRPDWPGLLERCGRERDAAGVDRPN